MAQMKVIAGQPKKNVETMLQMIEKAKSQSADIIIFPEMCVGGYCLGDRWLDPEICQDLNPRKFTNLL